MIAVNSAQGRGFAKGFGLGLMALTVIYAGLYAWVTTAGPGVLAERDSKAPSQTVVIERVLPLNPVLQKPVMGPPAPTPKADEHAAAEPVPVETAHATEMPVVEHPAEPAHTEAAPEKTDPTKDLKKYANGMVVAPVEGLYENKEAGRLPIIGKGELTPFKAYKKPFVAADNKPVISIAVADMGLSDKITESAIKSLPGEVSLIVSPYADGPETWTNEAREGGHEVWLVLPMESSSYPKIDSGPHTLLIGAPERENLQKLDWIMSRTAGYTGLVASYDAVFMNSQNDVRPILGELYKRGVGFMSNNGAGTLPETMALSMNAPYSKIDVWIDRPEGTAEIIKASLQQLETLARENGYAAGIISPNSTSFRELQAWIETLKGKGFVLAPLSVQTGY